MSYLLSEMRTYLEEITHTANDASFPGSVYELQLLNKAYEKSAYKFDWPSTVKRWFDPLVAYVDRYSLQSDFRKFIFMRVQGTKFEKTEIEAIMRSRGKYAVAPDSLEYLLSFTPTTATTAYTTSGSLSAGNAVAITVSSVDGLSAGDEIWISDTTSSEFTKIQSVDSTLVTITCKLKNTHTTGKSLYRVSDGVYYAEQKIITLLTSASDTPILPSDTHLVIPHYAAALYYTDIEEPDRAKTHMDRWSDELNEAWLAFDKDSEGAAGEFTL